VRHQKEGTVAQENAMPWACVWEETGAPNTKNRGKDYKKNKKVPGERKEKKGKSDTKNRSSLPVIRSIGTM